jgi:Leucine-rich repeat (LRR) protein
MKKKYFALLLILINSALTAQKITFSDPVFKAKLLQSDADSMIARNLSDDYFAIDVNSNGEIEINEALQVAHLDIENASISSLSGIENFINLVSLQCGNNSINDLNIGAFTKLTDLNCNNNNLNTISLTGAINLKNLYCQSNQLMTLNLDDLTNLLSVDCSDNKLTSVQLNNLNNLESLICNNNVITALDLNDLINLLTLECTRNKLSDLNTSLLVNIESLNCNFNQISTLDVTTLLDLKNLNCTNNQLKSVAVDGLTRLSTLNCNFNQLTQLKVNTLSSITFLYCKNNNLQTLEVKGLTKLKVIDFTNNQLTTLDINGLTNLQYLYGSNNKLITLDATNQTELQFLFVSDNLLNSLYIKNGSAESALVFSGNLNLNYICADESEIQYVQDEILNNGYTNCFVNSYCSFVPAGNYYTIESINKIDNNTNGCDNQDGNFLNLKLIISNGSNATTFIPDSTGSYSYGVKEGSYTIFPVLENPAYYTISPKSTVISFPETSSPFLTNYCITPNGIHNDLEIMILPIDNARNNFDSKYKIVYKNKGTVTLSETVNLTFDANALNLETANPIVSSQSSGNLNWNFSNLQPQETRNIFVTLKVKPSVSNGYLLKYKASISSSNDETPQDNSFDISQVVMNTTNSNDKICLEGDGITPSKIGDYLHYMIRFENTSSSIARNVVLKDIIDISKFDISTLVPLSGSHLFDTKITDNTVEFIFQNINLPIDAVNNKGYVVFKIKTLPELVLGDEITNSASIYFDYYQPIISNIAKTNILALNTQDIILSDFFLIYPNPVKNILTIVDKKQSEISSIAIYNNLGQLVQMYINATNNSESINVSQLRTGLYFIKIDSKKGSIVSKFIKE